MRVESLVNSEHPWPISPRLPYGIHASTNILQSYHFLPYILQFMPHYGSLLKMASTENTHRRGFLPLWLSVRLEEYMGIRQIIQAAASREFRHNNSLSQISLKW